MVAKAEKGVSKSEKELEKLQKELAKKEKELEKKSKELSKLEKLSKSGYGSTEPTCIPLVSIIHKLTSTIGSFHPSYFKKCAHIVWR